ncbi:MAG: helix-turn-helix transcriptional regulator [Bacteroidales bacterium]|jgi:putative transcriptional regulator|nr:helix-turn-helix transcriptional regulator [Bacteroidales bacterium]
MKNKIRIERAVLNISQQELAERVQVSRQTINAIELEKYVPSATVVMKIAHVFGKSVNEVFELEDKDWK